MTTPPLPLPAHDAPLPRASEASGGVRVLSGVPFAAWPGVRPLELDLYLPAAGSERGPVVVFLHGGGWRLGSRRTLGPAYATMSPTPFERVAAAGIAVASVDYRLSGEAQWPAQLHDAKAAVRWLRARADELGIDPERIASWGESAGGHLASLLGLTGPELDSELGVTGPSSAVKAVVAWYAPSDLAAMPADTGTDPMADDSREALLLGGPVVSEPAKARQASPLSYAAPGAPPFLLLHGRADRLIPCVQSERLRDALQQAGSTVESEFYNSADHMWFGAPDSAVAALDRTIAFLLRRL